MLYKDCLFQSKSEILYQDVIEGNLFVQAEKAFDLLFSKYMKALISYKGVQRIERFAYDTEAVREVLHNAIVHKDYSSGIPIQIGVFEDKLFIYNPGHLPRNWTVKTLTEPHRSIPFNPDIANVFLEPVLLNPGGGVLKRLSDLPVNTTVQCRYSLLITV